MDSFWAQGRLFDLSGMLSMLFDLQFAENRTISE